MHYRQHATGRPQRVPVDRGNRPLARRHPARGFAQLSASMRLAEIESAGDRRAPLGLIIGFPMSLALWCGVAIIAHVL